MSHAESYFDLARSEFARTSAERAWDKWISTVERLVDGRITPAPDLLLSDEAELALFAFDDGTSADDYAVELVARLGVA